MDLLLDECSSLFSQFYSAVLLNFAGAPFACCSFSLTPPLYHPCAWVRQSCEDWSEWLAILTKHQSNDQRHWRFERGRHCIANKTINQFYYVLRLYIRDLILNASDTTMAREFYLTILLNHVISVVYIPHQLCWMSFSADTWMRPVPNVDFRIRYVLVCRFRQRE